MLLATSLGTSLGISLVLALASGQALAQVPGVTSPRAFLGFNFGDDYQLANYQKISAYWRTLGNRLAARLALPEYTGERHAAWLAGKVLP